MRICFVGVALVGALSVSMPAWSYSSCDGASKESMPSWVSNRDGYFEPGNYVGVGFAEKDGRSKEQQIEASKNNAQHNLVGQIEVKIKTESEQSTSVSNQRMQKEASSKMSVISDEVLRGLKIKAHWVDRDCTYYTLMVISIDSVKQSQKVKNQKNRLELFKVRLAEGTNREKNRDIAVRQKYLGEAQALLGDIDFSLLPEEAGDAFYNKQLDAALIAANKEVANVKGRMALFAINEDGSLSADVRGKMLDHLRSGEKLADRLMDDCNQKDDCIRLAKEQNFDMLTLLNAGTQVVTTQMGSLKGTLTVSKTVYDIQNGRVLKTDKMSTQVIGWGREELDWGAAAEKVMQSFK